MYTNHLDQLINFQPNSPLQKLDDPWLEQFNVSVSIKRDDLIDPIVSGNKFRKLKYILSQYDGKKYAGIVSFGGAWSNHLHALAHLTQHYKIPMTALVRGEKPKVLSDSLLDIDKTGAKIEFVNRIDYRDIRALSLSEELCRHPRLADYQDFFIIPEGGYSGDALAGVADIAIEICGENKTFDALYLASGTATTLAGLCIGFAEEPNIELVGVAAIKAAGSLTDNVQQLLRQQTKRYTTNYCVNDDFHCGGFAKTNNDLTQFMLGIYRRTGLLTEPVYTGKALLALYHNIENGIIKEGSNVLFLHTGGLQGLRGYRDKCIDELIAALPKVDNYRHLAS